MYVCICRYISVYIFMNDINFDVCNQRMYPNNAQHC